MWGMARTPGTSVPQPVRAAEERSARIAVTVFPLLILAGGAVALVFPEPFSGLGPLINPGLMVIMFGMGLTLTLPDFALVVRQPLPVLLGVVAQFGPAPSSGAGGRGHPGGLCARRHGVECCGLPGA